MLQREWECRSGIAECAGSTVARWGALPDFLVLQGQANADQGAHKRHRKQDEAEAAHSRIDDDLVVTSLQHAILQQHMDSITMDS